MVDTKIKDLTAKTTLTGNEELIVNDIDNSNVDRKVTIGNSRGVGESSYIIYKSGSTIYAKNGTTGIIQFSGTEAATVFQSCIDTLAATNIEGTAGKIFVRTGIYTINSTILITGNLTIEGENRSSTCLKLGNSINDNMLEWDATKDTQYFFVLREMMLDGNRDNNTLGNGIFTENVAAKLLSDGYIDNCFIRRFSESGIYLKFLWGWHVTNTISEQNDGEGIRLSGTNIHVSNCRFLENGTEGIDLSGGQSIFEGNQIRGSGTEGMVVIGANTGLRIIGNQFFENSKTLANTDDDLFLSNTNNAIVEGNSFDGQSTARYGIVIGANCDNTIISDNQFYNHATGTISDSGVGTVINNSPRSADIDNDAYSIIHQEIATPAVPAANNIKTYAKDYAGITQSYQETEFGLETPLSMIAKLSKRDYYFGPGSDLPTALGVDALNWGLPATTSSGTYANKALVAADGFFKNIASAATTDTNAGFVTIAMSSRSANPVLFARFRVISTAVRRMWLGWVESTQMGSDTDATIHKVALRLSTSAANTNFCIVHSDGTTETIVQVGTDDAGIHTLLIIADDANSRFGYSFDSAAITWISTNIPASGVGLLLEAQVRTLEDAAKNWDIAVIKGFMDR